MTKQEERKKKQQLRATVKGMDLSTPFRFSPEKIFAVKRGQKDKALNELAKDSGKAAKSTAVQVAVMKEAMATGTSAKDARSSLRKTVESGLAWLKGK